MALMAVIVLLIGSVVLSNIYLSPDNPYEEGVEEVLEEVAENELNLKDGSMKGKIDLSPKTKEN